jgi:hypothetical protein
MFIVALLTIIKIWKQPRCPNTDEWIKKMWYLYTMEFYSVTKENENLSFAGKWVELENILLHEVSRVQKAKSCIFFLLYVDFIQTQQYYEKQVMLRRGPIWKEDKRKKLRR